MFKRLVSASVITLAVAVSTFTGALAAGTGSVATSATSVGTQATDPPAPLPLYCPPPVTSVVCSALPTPVPCKGCSAPAAQPAAPDMMCSPEIQVVCTVLGATVCNAKHPCEIDAGAAAAPAIYCDVPVLCTVLALTVCRHGCELDIAGAAAAPARVDSLPGDPCSREWPWPIEAVCHG